MTEKYIEIIGKINNDLEEFFDSKEFFEIRNKYVEKYKDNEILAEELSWLSFHTKDIDEYVIECETLIDETEEIVSKSLSKIIDEMKDDFTQVVQKYKTSEIEKMEFQISKRFNTDMDLHIILK